MRGDDDADQVSLPIAGMWSVEGTGAEHPGVLDLDGGHLHLRLLIDGTRLTGSGWSHLTLDACEPPRQPTCTGRTARTPAVSLLRCVQESINESSSPGEMGPRIELVLRPDEAWIGDTAMGGGPYTELSFKAAGLHQILATSRMKTEFLDGRLEDGSWQKILRDSTGAGEAHLVFAGETARVDVTYRGKPFGIAFTTVFGGSRSGFAGIAIKSWEEIVVTSPGGATIEELSAVKFEVEKFLSVLCVGRYRGGGAIVKKDPLRQGARLLWKLGRASDDGASSVERMPYQVLVPLGRHPAVARHALARWFAASDQRRLARWLAYDTLSGTRYTIGRFLALAQTWEIIGREVSSRHAHDPTTWARSCDEAAQAFERNLGTAAAERAKGLLKSNNRPSLRDMVEECLKLVPPLAVQQICGDPSKFARLVARTRNALTHLDDEPSAIDDASRTAFWLTDKLAVLFCILEAQQLGLPLDNLASMLVNNETAMAAQRPSP